MSNWFVSYGELAEVVTDHFWLYVYGYEFFAVVYADFCTYHFWEDD